MGRLRRGWSSATAASSAATARGVVPPQRMRSACGDRLVARDIGSRPRMPYDLPPTVRSGWTLDLYTEAMTGQPRNQERHGFRQPRGGLPDRRLPCEPLAQGLHPTRQPHRGAADRVRQAPRGCRGPARPRLRHHRQGLPAGPRLPCAHGDREDPPRWNGAVPKPGNDGCVALYCRPASVDPIRLQPNRLVLHGTVTGTRSTPSPEGRFPL